MKPHTLLGPVQIPFGHVGQRVPGKSERELLEELEQTYERYEGLNHSIRLATQRARFSANPSDVQRARADEARSLVEINRLMGRMRALEGHLLRARGKLQALVH